MSSNLQSTTLSQANPALRVMFEARKRVFVDLLRWNVPVLGGQYEVDQFDTSDAEYLILTDEAGVHRASARLLRTEGPHILTDLFRFLCKGAVPSGPTTREITRFCLEPRLAAAERRQARNQLVTALVGHALRTGITDYTGVAGLGWFRQIAAFGWDCQALGEAVQVGAQCLIALHIQVNEATLEALKHGGVYSPLRLGHVSAGGVQ